MTSCYLVFSENNNPVRCTCLVLYWVPGRFWNGDMSGGCVYWTPAGPWSRQSVFTGLWLSRGPGSLCSLDCGRAVVPTVSVYWTVAEPQSRQSVFTGLWLSRCPVSLCLLDCSQSVITLAQVLSPRHGLCSNIKTIFPAYGLPSLRRPSDRLFGINGIPYW